jgi:hypothetical protein
MSLILRLSDFHILPGRVAYLEMRFITFSSYLSTKLNGVTILIFLPRGIQTSLPQNFRVRLSVAATSPSQLCSV